MKKVLFLIAALLVVSVPEAYAIKIPVYGNGRVLKMCREFPKCDDWAKAQFKKDSSFLITDAELELYFVNKENVLKTNLYVKASRQGKEEAYVIKGELKSTAGFFGPKRESSFLSPVKIKYFPGHPFANDLSDFVMFFNMTIKEHQEKEAEIKAAFAKRWPNLISALGLWDLANSITEQQRVIWDKSGKPTGWKRSLRIEMHHSSGHEGSTLRVTLDARQNKLNGPYVYTKGDEKTQFVY